MVKGFMKAQTMLIDHNGKKKINEGDSVICLQGTKVGERIESNMDWSFDKSWTPSEIKSLLGVFLASIEDLFGEKMVTEAISHYAEDTGKLVKNDKGQAMLYFKSHGLGFAKGGNYGK